MNIKDYTQEELDALEEQANSIAVNLKYIEEHEIYQKGLEALEEQTGNIADNLKLIEDHQ